MYQPSSEVIHQRVGDELVIINLKNDQIYLLNKTGARFWELINTYMTLDDIKRQLKSEFEVDSEQLDQEIQTILSLLIREGLVREEAT